MAFSVKGKGKMIAISATVTAVLMMIGGSLTAGLIGGRAHEWVIVGIGCAYGVWLSLKLSKDTEKPS